MMVAIAVEHPLPWSIFRLGKSLPVTIIGNEIIFGAPAKGNPHYGNSTADLRRSFHCGPRHGHFEHHVGGQVSPDPPAGSPGTVDDAIKSTSVCAITDPEPATSPGV
jgi:hypothetical protein